MDYLIDFTTTVPEGTPAAEAEQRMKEEGARVVELYEQGHALRVWLPVPDEGPWRAVALYNAADDAELQTILESLPLYPWMELKIRALAPHPNDPSRSAT